MQATRSGNAIAKMDIRAAASHVRRDRHATRVARLRDDLRFRRILPCVEQLVLDAPPP